MTGDALPTDLAARLGPLLAMVEAGGLVVVVLACLSVAALAIVLAKLFQFRAIRLGVERPVREALDLWQAGRTAGAIALADASPDPVSQSLARAMRGRELGLPDALVREEVQRYGGEVLASLRGWLRPLEVIAALAPLLGLFGTVLGMIEAFRALEAAGNRVDPAILSGGIWQALLTTALGLAVAMPVVALLAWLERRVERTAEAMESQVTRVFTRDLSAEARTVAGSAPGARPAQPLAAAGE
jgi:biopolymer transport protein ExbB